MNKYLAIVFLIFIFSCQEDEASIPTPRIETSTAILFEDGGVELKGEITNLNTEVIYGIIISTYQGGTLSGDTFYNLSMTDFGMVNGEFSFEFRNNLIQGQTYFYNAILFFDDEILLGEEMSFVSNGSASPRIDLVEPLIGHVGDTITIKGKYFSDDFSVYFDQREAELIEPSDSIVKAIVPFEYNRDTPYDSFRLTKATQESILFEDFSMYTPEVYTVEPYYAHENDTITITGNHFNLHNLENRVTMEVFGNYQELEIIESSRTQIKILNAGWFYDLFPRMRLKSQFQTVDFNDLFQAKLPVITDGPDCFSYGETITIYGEDFPRVGYNFNSQFSLSIGNVSFSASEIHRDRIVLNVEDGFYTDFILEDIVIQYLGETITYETEICVDEPWIKVSFDNPQHQPHNYLNETYGIVYQNNQNFVTVGKLNTDSYQFESVLNTELPEAVRYGSLRTWHQDKLYHYDISPNVNKFYSYNFLTGSLTELAPFPGDQRVNGLMTTVGGYIYLGLGRSNTYTPYNDIWRYSINTNTWELVFNFPGINSSSDAIEDPLVFAFEDALFFGGINGNNPSNLFYELDLNTFSLIPKAPLPIPSADGKKGVTLNSKGYFESYYLYEYDRTTDQWTTHQDIEGIGFVYSGSNESLFTNNGTIYRSVTTSAPYYSLLFKMNMSYLLD